MAGPDFRTDDVWCELCLDAMVRLKPIDEDEAAQLVRAASHVRRFRDMSPEIAANELLVHSVVQPSLRGEA